MIDREPAECTVRVFRAANCASASLSQENRVVFLDGQIIPFKIRFTQLLLISLGPAIAFVPFPSTSVTLASSLSRWITQARLAQSEFSRSLASLLIRPFAVRSPTFAAFRMLPEFGRRLDTPEVRYRLVLMATDAGSRLHVASPDRRPSDEARLDRRQGNQAPHCIASTASRESFRSCGSDRLMNQPARSARFIGPANCASAVLKREHEIIIGNGYSIRLPIILSAGFFWFVHFSRRRIYFFSAVIANRRAT